MYPGMNLNYCECIERLFFQELSIKSIDIIDIIEVSRCPHNDVDFAK